MPESALIPLEGYRMVYMAAAGPSRHVAAPQQFGRFRGEADMNRIYEDTDSSRNPACLTSG